MTSTLSLDEGVVGDRSPRRHAGATVSRAASFGQPVVAWRCRSHHRSPISDRYRPGGSRPGGPQCRDDPAPPQHPGALPRPLLESLTRAFRKQFQLPETAAAIADRINLKCHHDWIETFLMQHQAAVADALAPKQIHR